MPREALPELIHDVRLRAEGMANHLDVLASVGLGQVDVDEGYACALAMETLNAEQEALKAALKAKTAELGAAQNKARKWRSSVTKRIKAALEDEPEQWVEYGIRATR